MRPSLADRLRGIVSIPHIPAEVRPSPDVGQPTAIIDVSLPPRARPSLERTADVLGGQVMERAEGAVIVIDRHYAVDRLHGRERIGGVIETLQNGREALGALRRAWPCKSSQPIAIDQTPRLLFLDIETTGLAGGAGTQAFLVGSAALERDELLVRQFLLPGFEHERALLAALREWSAAHDTIVSFNGRTFDVPLIETRYLFHRLEFPLADRPHIDMLHASRRLWKERPAVAGPPLDEDSCKLSVLERHLAGVHRVGDVPGLEIPSRFFRFVRSGEAFPLEAVLEHNRIDLVSLALVMARTIRLIERGPAETMHPRECLGLARLYERAGMRDHAEASYLHAASTSARVGREPDVRAEALRRLAVLRRRAGRPVEAAQAWAEIVTLPGCPALIRREAREALAIHHEHRSRDLRTARMFVLDALAEVPAARWRDRAEHRLRRIEGKLARSAPGPLIDWT
jgi:uncharacterized protein YprB with RNaseH-like and TPR domain